MQVIVDGEREITLKERVNTGGSVSPLADTRENSVLPSTEGVSEIVMVK